VSKEEIKAELQKLIMGMHQGNKDARLDQYAERVHGLVEALGFYGDAGNYEPGSGATPSFRTEFGEVIENEYAAIADDMGTSAREALAKFKGAKGGNE